MMSRHPHEGQTTTSQQSGPVNAKENISGGEKKVGSGLAVNISARLLILLIISSPSDEFCTPVFNLNFSHLSSVSMSPPPSD